MNWPGPIQIVRPDKSLVPYRVNRFPDGQVQVAIKKEDLQDVPHRLTFSLATEENSMLAAQIGTIFDNASIPIEDIKVVYMYGARCDKAENDTEYVACAAGITLGTLIDWADGRTGVFVLCPHCNIDGARDHLVFPMNLKLEAMGIDIDNYDFVVYPDKSAKARWGGAIDLPEIVCDKVRDQQTGEITKFTFPKEVGSNARVLVADDICDGGRTFRMVRDALPRSCDVDLLIAHGVFSGNSIAYLTQNYNHIFVTDSLPNLSLHWPGLSEEERSKFTVTSVWEKGA